MAVTTKNDFTYEIKADYEAGGMNYFSGVDKKRGYRVCFNKYTVEYFNDGMSSMKKIVPRDPDNFIVFIKPAKRFSQKQKEKIDDWVEANKDELFRLYFEDRVALMNILDDNFKVKGSKKWKGY